MRTITLTVEVTLAEMALIIAILDTSPDTHTAPPGPKVPSADTLPAGVAEPLYGAHRATSEVTAKSPSQSINITELDALYGKTNRQPEVVKTKPTGRSKTSMPSFGRSQAQVDAYANSEASRIEIADEEAQLKQERKDAKAAEKAEVAADKARAQAELKSIAEAIIDTPAAPTHLVKPWGL